MFLQQEFIKIAGVAAIAISLAAMGCNGSAANDDAIKANIASSDTSNISMENLMKPATSKTRDIDTISNTSTISPADAGIAKPDPAKK